MYCDDDIDETKRTRNEKTDIEKYSIKIITYNIQMLGDCFSYNTNYWNRENHLLKYIKKLDKLKSPDVIVFQEVFSKRAEKILQELKNDEEVKYIYQTPVIGSVNKVGCSKSENNNEYWNTISGEYNKFSAQNGGVMIISKFPIIEQHCYIFKSFANVDGLSKKGCILVKIKKYGKTYNIVGVHMQSEDKYDHIRKKQVVEMMDWLNSSIAEHDDIFVTDEVEDERKKKMYCIKKRKKEVHNCLINSCDPLIYCGDFNIDYYFKNHFNDILTINYLNGYVNFDDFTKPKTSFDTSLNDTALAQYGNKIKYKCLYDYIILSKSHGGKFLTHQEVITQEADDLIDFTSYKFFFFPSKKCKVHHVSDHFPVFSHIAWHSNKYFPA